MFLWIWSSCSQQTLNKSVGHSMIFDKFFAYMWLGTWDNLHSPITSQQPIVICTFCMRNCARTRLLNCSRLVDHTCISLVSQMNLIGQIYIYIFVCVEGGIWRYHMHPFLEMFKHEIQQMFYAHYFPSNNTFSMFQVPSIYPNVTSTFVHGILTTNIEWNTLKTILSKA